MTAECLYNNIKDVLKFFNIPFKDMDLVTIKVKKNSIEFSYEDRSITIQVR